MVHALGLNKTVKSKYGMHFTCYNIYILSRIKIHSFVDTLELSQLNISSNYKVFKAVILNNCIT